MRPITKIISFTLLPLFAVAAPALGFEDTGAHKTLAIGSPAPDFSLPGVDGKVHRLSDYSASRVLVVVFTCDHCPTAQLYENRIKKLAADYQDKSVAFVAINPNDADAVRLDEMGYTDVGDDPKDMKIRAEYRKFNFDYLYDGATETVAEAYGPKATPHVFVFDQQRRLQFEGRVDNSPRPSLVKSQDARNAIDAILAGKPVSVPHTGVFGCSIKWKSKESGRAAEWQSIAAEPVRLQPVDVDELKKLRSNPTGKVLVVNFWATWCGPCIAEFPGMEDTFRMYRNRDFELVTVSTNLPDEAPGVLKALEKLHASGRNLQFASTDTYKLQSAFDPKWESGVPFTIVLAPNGAVVYRKEGEVDILTLRRILLANIPDPDYIGIRALWATQ